MNVHERDTHRGYPKDATRQRGGGGDMLLRAHTHGMLFFSMFRAPRRPMSMATSQCSMRTIVAADTPCTTRVCGDGGREEGEVTDCKEADKRDVATRTAPAGTLCLLRLEVVAMEVGGGGRGGGWKSYDESCCGFEHNIEHNIPTHPGLTHTPGEPGDGLYGKRHTSPAAKMSCAACGATKGQETHGERGGARRSAQAVGRVK